MKRKILVDICVVGVAKFYTKDMDYKIAKEFIERIERGEFEVITPFPLIETVVKWRDKILKKQALDFYSLHSTEILSTEKITKKIVELKINYKKIMPIFKKHGIKEEDATLVLIASAFELTLVTLNRKHLRNKKDEINEILREAGLNEIEILLPNEI
jgi:predicted nucleic acid-binding protein